jgi:hypothetical protein
MNNTKAATPTRRHIAIRGALMLPLAILAHLLFTGCSDGSDSPDVHAPPYDARIVVTDDDATGAVGDNMLSLAEAINLANGTLSRDALSEAEADSIAGEPGAASRDEIRFDVTGGAVRFPLQIQEKSAIDFAVLSPVSLMPPLAGNDGDAIIGDGIRFTNGPDDAIDTTNTPPFYNGAPLGGLGLILSSSDITVSGVTFERFILSMQVLPTGEAGLANISITGNRFHNGGGVGFSASTASGRGRLTALQIEDNEFLGPEHFDELFPSTLHTAISVLGAGSTASNAQDGATVVLSDIYIAGNTIDQIGTGVQIQPLQALFGPNRNARLSGLIIEGNIITQTQGAVDPAIYVWGAINVGGSVSNVAMTDVLITDNTVAGNGYLIFVAGVEVLLGGSTPSSAISLDGIRITGNTLNPVASCVVGITTIAAFVELGGSTVSDASISNVEITENQVTGCNWGALATPVYNVGAPDISAGNVIEGLRYEGNRIEQASIGIVVAGGALAAEAFDGEAGIEYNSARGVYLKNNRFSTTESGMLLAGGLARGSASGLVGYNTLSVEEIDGNSQPDCSDTPVCQIRDDADLGSGAIVTQNQVTGNAVCD